MSEYDFRAWVGALTRALADWGYGAAALIEWWGERGHARVTLSGCSVDGAVTWIDTPMAQALSPEQYRAWWLGVPCWLRPTGAPESAPEPFERADRSGRFVPRVPARAVADALEVLYR